MAQQMVNGSRYDGSRTLTNRMSDRYAVVGEPYKGKHLKPQDNVSKLKRKQNWEQRWKEYRFNKSHNLKEWFARSIYKSLLDL